MEKPTVAATFDKDTRRFHRFIVDEKDVKGILYLSKDGEKIPDELRIKLRTKNEK